MFWIASLLFLMTALGLLALSAKYLLGPAPTDYHASILRLDGGEISPTQVTMFTAINRVLGCCQLSIAVGAFTLAWVGLSGDLLWAKLAFLAMVLVAGVPSALAAYKVEGLTGVTTPWRPAAALTALGAAGFVASLF